MSLLSIGAWLLDQRDTTLQDRTIQLPNMVISLLMEGRGAFDRYEDCILFVARVYDLVLLVRNWKTIGRRRRDE